MIRFNQEKNQNEIALINIFESINGEAYNAGKPTVFIRTFGCNLRCPFCDTQECWNEENLLKVYPERKNWKSTFKWMTAEEIFKYVNDIENDYQQKSICLTGGEPLLPENKDFMIGELIPLFVNEHYDVGIETDGGVDYTDYKKAFGNSKIINMNGDREGVTIIADYKLPCSKMTKFMIKSNFDLYSESDVVKMVISDLSEDWEELEKIVNSGTKASLYLSPCFEQVTMNKIPEFIIAHPDKKIRCQLQEHKFFWPVNKKDV